MWRSVSPLVPGLAHAHHHHHTHTTEASAASASERSAQRNSRGPFLQHGTPELAWGSCALRLAIRALHGGGWEVKKGNRLSALHRGAGRSYEICFGYIACMGLSTGMARQKYFTYFCQKHQKYNQCNHSDLCAGRSPATPRNPLR
jgi:hypothetical protein